MYHTQGIGFLVAKIFYPTGLRDKTMDETLIYIPFSDKQIICRLKDLNRIQDDFKYLFLGWIVSG